MAHQNKQCAECNATYHHCSSCSEPDYEATFCSSQCLLNYRQQHLPKLATIYGLTVDKIWQLLNDLENYNFYMGWYHGQ